MDYTTLMDVVAMLDARIAVLEAEGKIDSPDAFDIGKRFAYEEFSDYLQEFIDLKVAQIEGV